MTLHISWQLAYVSIGPRLICWVKTSSGLRAARSGLQRAFVCLKIIFLSHLKVSEEALGEWICTQAATVLIVTSHMHFGLTIADVSRQNGALQDQTELSVHRLGAGSASADHRIEQFRLLVKSRLASLANDLKLRWPNSLHTKQHGIRRSRYSGWGG